ncbi:MAG: class I SAM-dependent methyltransferase [Polyangiaceae bacterium]|nr:class I SAM-dependent methyltransferase [Polyangiaceae bacterium]
MKREILKHLVDPDSRAPLSLSETSEQNGDVREGKLDANGKSYPIREGIPSFVSEDVRGDQTVQSFGDKWDQHRYYKDHTRRFYTEWYLARFGFGTVDGLKSFLADKRFILDAGTGAGRDAANFAENSGSTVFGVDTAWHALSNAGAQPNRPAVNLVHADVNRLPFPDEFFDFINCDQVIHHTPNPPVTFKNLGKKLKKGGELTTYVYRKKSVIREFTDDYVRERIKDQSFEKALEVCEAITKMGKAFSDLKANVTIEEDIPILGITKGTYDVQRFLHWHVMKCFWNDEFDFFTNNVVNADWYHPVYCFRYTPEEFRAWFAEGWEIVAWDEQEAGISCRARKV